MKEKEISRQKFDDLKSKSNHIEKNNNEFILECNNPEIEY